MRSGKRGGEERPFTTVFSELPGVLLSSKKAPGTVSILNSDLWSKARPRVFANVFFFLAGNSATTFLTLSKLDSDFVISKLNTLALLKLALCLGFGEGLE